MSSSGGQTPLPAELCSVLILEGLCPAGFIGFCPFQVLQKPVNLLKQDQDQDQDWTLLSYIRLFSEAGN